MNRKGSTIVLSLLAVMFLLSWTLTMFMRSAAELKATETSLTLQRAFHLAEAGVDSGYINLKKSLYWNDCSEEIFTQSISQNEVFTYSSICDSVLRVLRTSGTFTDSKGFQGNKQLEAIVGRPSPQDFYDVAIYGNENLDFNGNAYIVDGTVITNYDGELENMDNVTGDVIQTDDSFPQLDMEYLHSIALSQGHVYSGVTLHNADIPETFWYVEPTDPLDPSTGVPNVLYITSDLTLGPHINTIGGIIIVAGSEMIPSQIDGDTSARGNITINGILYTTGNFTVNGGGNIFNVNGSILAGGIATLNGNVDVSYNVIYSQAFENLAVTTELEILMWREI